MISSFRQGRSAPHQNCQSRFLRYLGRRDELALWSAYELGREGLSGGVSLLEVVQIHHRVLVDVLNDTGGTQHQDVAEAATTFLLEVLAPFEMTRRASSTRAPRLRSTLRRTVPADASPTTDSWSTSGVTRPDTGHDVEVHGAPGR
jgi:Phosphoserine phosphatase RsbU, N-terminal domain